MLSFGYHLMIGQGCGRLLRKKKQQPELWAGAEYESYLYTFIFGFESPILQSGVFYMVLSSCFYEFDLN